MIEFYTWNTPNGQKVAIMLEELQIDYQTHPINIQDGEQLTEAFLKINPNHKIPVITDTQGPHHEPITIRESGAILIYLAEKTGRFLPSDLRDRYTAIEWLMFQMASVGPMFGQLNHFTRAAPEEILYAIDRYRKEVLRLYGVMDQHLKNHRYFANEFSIADIAMFPWINIYQRQGINMEEFPHVKRFIHDMAERPAVKRGLELMEALTNAAEVK